MRQTILFILAVTISSLVYAQAYEGSVEYGKKKQRAFVIDFHYSTDAVENAVIQKMGKMGYKGKEEKGLFNKDKGFHVFKNAYITDISQNSMDYMFKAEQKSRKEKDESVLYLIIYSGGDNAMEKFSVYDIEQAKAFLNNLTPEVEAANLELRIKDQENTVAKAEKKYKSLQSDKDDMEKKIKKLQDDIQKNLKDQEDTQKDIENQKQVLENLRLKRTPVEKTL